MHTHTHTQKKYNPPANAIFAKAKIKNCMKMMFGAHSYSSHTVSWQHLYSFEKRNQLREIKIS